MEALGQQVRQQYHQVKIMLQQVAHKQQLIMQGELLLQTLHTILMVLRGQLVQEL